MVLITQDGDVFNFDNVVAVWRHGKYIHVKVPHGTDCAVATYDTEERTEEVMAEFRKMARDMFVRVVWCEFPKE